MAKWKNYSGLKVDRLDDAISKIMEEYGDIIFEATNEGINDAAKELAKLEKAATPKGATGDFANGWRVQAPRYKLVRFIGNDKTVPSKNGAIALANIFEYSTTRGNPFIKRTFEANATVLAKIIMNRVKKDA